jgi:purine-cytosine permease-like protein
MPQRPPRLRIDLFRLLSPAVRTAVALAVIAAVAVAAWWIGRDRPVPPAVENVLVPLLGWAWLALAGVAIASWWLRRRRARDDDPRRPKP